MTKKLFEKKIYLDLTGGSQTTPLQKSLILGVGEGLRPSRKQVEQAMLTSQIPSKGLLGWVCALPIVHGNNDSLEFRIPS
jgi:hypothetical protein